MKKYKFKYPTAAKIILLLALIACIAGLFWNIFNLVQLSSGGISKTVSYGLIIALIAFCLLIILSMFLFCSYYIKGDTLICKIGILKNAYDISGATEIVWFTEQNKLVLYFENGKFTVIIIDQTLFTDFVEDIRKANTKIVFTKQDKEQTQTL